MTIRQKSILGWLIGAGLGAIAGTLIVPNKRSKIKSPWIGATLGLISGAAFVGSINDKRLESSPGYTGR